MTTESGYLRVATARGIPTGTSLTLFDTSNTTGRTLEIRDTRESLCVYKIRSLSANSGWRRISSFIPKCVIRRHAIFLGSEFILL